MNIYRGGDVSIGDENIIAQQGSQIATGGGVAAGRDTTHVATSGGADARQGGTAAAGGSAIAREGSGASTGGSHTTVGLVERAKKSTWFQAWAVLALVLIVTTTVLLVVHVFDFEWAGYILAVIAAILGIAPLVGA